MLLRSDVFAFGKSDVLPVRFAARATCYVTEGTPHLSLRDTGQGFPETSSRVLGVPATPQGEDYEGRLRDWYRPRVVPLTLLAPAIVIRRARTSAESSLATRRRTIVRRVGANGERKTTQKGETRSQNASGFQP